MVELDLRQIAPAQRHALIFDTFNDLTSDDEQGPVDWAVTITKV